MSRLWLLLVLVFGFLKPMGLVAEQPHKDAQHFFVAPNAVGVGCGSELESPANFRDRLFWQRVRVANLNQPVIVNFVEGTYLTSADPSRNMPMLDLTNLGNEKYPLTLNGLNPANVVFSRLDTDSLDTDSGPGLMQVTWSENVSIRNFLFTSPHPMGYCTYFGRNQNVMIENCTWTDLPRVRLSATGASEFQTKNVTFKDCTFRRIGNGPHAHMIYCAYEAKHIQLVSCHFEDCAGDYVRFRDDTDYGVVMNCTFKSTGEYQAGGKPATSVPFIAVPLFNDDDPNEGKSCANYEYFGTHFLIFNNSFTYDDASQRQGTSVALLFHHSGYDPPGRTHLLDANQATLLKSGNIEEKRALLLKNCGIDTQSVCFFDNSFQGVGTKVGYRCFVSFGAKSRGFTGLIDISETIPSKSYSLSEQKALRFFE